MKFIDEKIEKFDLKSIENLELIIVEYLCGEISHKKGDVSEKDVDLIKEFLKQLTKSGVNYEQFNEMLLLFNQGRISRDFFNFIFEKEEIDLEEIKKGIMKFRGYAMLCFGNISFAYKELMKKNYEEIQKILKIYCKDSEKIKENFKSRPRKMLCIDGIPREDTWMIGETYERKIMAEIEYINFLKETELKNDQEFKSLSKEYLELGDKLSKVSKKGLKNTDIYLTWDYMDIYIATSMRNKTEFYQTYDFIKNIFNNKKLNELKLRFFDPTQSKCNNRIDKGLVEGLMLKRVFATIYMVQESDTMGKDSELAATLAQGKPVIAYVPKIDIEKFSDEIKNYPFSYFKETFDFLDFKNVFGNENFKNEIMKKIKNHKDVIRDFKEYILKIEEGSEKNNEKLKGLMLWQSKKSDQLKNNFKKFKDLITIISVGKYCNFEDRARILKELHPLAIQIVLESGVANGVLVVRDEEECVKLLCNLITNNVKFIIKEIEKENWKITVLFEKDTGCPFRVVTNNIKITNSFWNFYLN